MGMTTLATSSGATHNSYELHVNSTNSNSQQQYTPISSESQDDMMSFQINNKPVNDVTDDVTHPPPYLSVMTPTNDEAKKSLLTPETAMTSSDDVMTSSST